MKYVKNNIFIILMMKLFPTERFIFVKWWSSEGRFYRNLNNTIWT